MTRSARDICAIGAQLLRQCTAGQDAVRLPVLLASGVDYLRWQLRPRRGFGPAHPFEVIPHKLFVKRSLRSAGCVMCCGPEARRVWRQRLVNPNQFIIQQAELEFCVSDDKSEEHTSELQSRLHLVCRLLLEKKKQASPLHNRTDWSGAR